MHGGGAPQVKRAARERLAALVDPAIDRLGELVRQRQFPSTVYAAVKDVLDRNGLKPPERTEHQFLDIDEHESDEALLARIDELLRKAREPEAGR